MGVDLASVQSPDFLKLLAHDVRWKILSVLARSDFCVQELVRLLDYPQNLVSYHLRRLREQDIITERRSSADGRDIYYSLDLDTLHRLYVSTAEALHPALSNTEATVLAVIPQNFTPLLCRSWLLWALISVSRDQNISMSFLVSPLIA